MIRSVHSSAFASINNYNSHTANSNKTHLLHGHRTLNSTPSGASTSTSSAPNSGGEGRSSSSRKAQQRLQQLDDPCHSSIATTASISSTVSSHTSSGSLGTSNSNSNNNDRSASGHCGGTMMSEHGKKSKHQSGTVELQTVTGIGTRSSSRHRGGSITGSTTTTSSSNSIPKNSKHGKDASANASSTEKRSLLSFRGSHHGTPSTSTLSHNHQHSSSSNHTNRRVQDVAAAALSSSASHVKAAVLLQAPPPSFLKRQNIFRLGAGIRKRAIAAGSTRTTGSHSLHSACTSDHDDSNGEGNGINRDLNLNLHQQLKLLDSEHPSRPEQCRSLSGLPPTYKPTLKFDRRRKNDALTTSAAASTSCLNHSDHNVNNKKTLVEPPTRGSLQSNATTVTSSSTMSTLTSTTTTHPSSPKVQQHHSSAPSLVHETHPPVALLTTTSTISTASAAQVDRNIAEAEIQLDKHSLHDRNVNRHTRACSALLHEIRSQPSPNKRHDYHNSTSNISHNNEHSELFTCGGGFETVADDDDDDEADYDDGMTNDCTNVVTTAAHYHYHPRRRPSTGHVTSSPSPSKTKDGGGSASINKTRMALSPLDCSERDELEEEDDLLERDADRKGVHELDVDNNVVRDENNNNHKKDGAGDPGANNQNTVNRDGLLHQNAMGAVEFLQESSTSCNFQNPTSGDDDTCSELTFGEPRYRRMLTRTNTAKQVPPSPATASDSLGVNNKENNSNSLNNPSSPQRQRRGVDSSSPTQMSSPATDAPPQQQADTPAPKQKPLPGDKNHKHGEMPHRREKFVPPAFIEFALKVKTDKEELARIEI